MNTQHNPSSTPHGARGLEWQASARCRAIATDAFFPLRTHNWGERIRLEQTAKQVCAECAVLLDCRAYALEREERFGVWGGLTETERRRHLAAVRRSKPKKAHSRSTPDP